MLKDVFSQAAHLGFRHINFFFFFCNFNSHVAGIWKVLGSKFYFLAGGMVPVSTWWFTVLHFLVQFCSSALTTYQEVTLWPVLFVWGSKQAWEEDTDKHNGCHCCPSDIYFYYTMVQKISILMCEPIHQSPDVICFPKAGIYLLILQDYFIPCFSLSQINGMICLNPIGLLYEFKWSLPCPLANCPGDVY